MSVSFIFVSTVTTVKYRQGTQHGKDPGFPSCISVYTAGRRCAWQTWSVAKAVPSAHIALNAEPLLHLFLAFSPM